MSRFGALPIQHIKDIATRKAFEGVQEQLQVLGRILNGTTKTDPVSGVASVETVYVAREVVEDPRTKSTQGKIGEIVRLPTGGLFQKVGRFGADTEWTAIGEGEFVPLTRLLTAGAGLTGTGDLSADRTLNIGANADGSIVVNADEIQVGVLATDAQHGNRGGGSIHALVVPAGAAGFMSGADKTKLDATPAAAVPTTRTLTAGAGLTGGGDLSADLTFDVVANADASIVVSTNDIKVGVLATDAQHGLRGGGTQHAVVIAAGAAGFLSGADKTILDGLAAASGSVMTFVIQASKPTPSATSPHVWIQDSGSGTQKWWVRLRKSSGPDVYDYHKTKEP